ncbi:unnamed protein product, partial [Brassica rapa subsp. narinosa]
ILFFSSTISLLHSQIFVAASPPLRLPYESVTIALL